MLHARLCGCLGAARESSQSVRLRGVWSTALLILLQKHEAEDRNCKLCRCMMILLALCGVRFLWSLIGQMLSWCFAPRPRLTLSCSFPRSAKILWSRWCCGWDLEHCLPCTGALLCGLRTHDMMCTHHNKFAACCACCGPPLLMAGLE